MIGTRLANAGTGHHPASRGTASHQRSRLRWIALTHVTGQDDFLLARGPGDGAGAGVVLGGAGSGVAGRVVAELGEHPGAQDGPQSGLAEVDLSVRVLTKTGLDRPF